MSTKLKTHSTSNYSSKQTGITYCIQVNFRAFLHGYQSEI